MSLDPESQDPAVSHSNGDGPFGDALDAEGDADEFDNGDDDRPRFCSLDPPCEVFADVRSRGVTTHADFSEACCRGQLNQIKIMVERGSMDLSEVDEQGKTVLHVAAGYRHCHEVLGLLLENGERFDKGDNVGAMPLHTAASSRNMVGVRQLLHFGAEVDVRDHNGGTPLFAACEAKAHRVIVELLERGANPSLVGGKDAQTPLHALLLASQNKASSKSSRARSGASTPGALGLRETVDAMVKAGAPLTAIDRSGQSVIDAAAACDAELLHHMLVDCNLAPANALVHAIKHGDTLAAKELLDSGKVEPCTVIDSNGRSLLHVAAAHGRLESAQLLLTGQWLQRQGTVPLNIDARDKIGRTALFHATLNASLDVAAFLLDAGASPAIQDGSGAGVGYTFTDDVVAEQKIAICELLARWGSRSGEERERAESFMSTKKAPDGEVVFFSGVVPYVHNSKTKHLWAPVNAPPPPAEAGSGSSSRHAARRLGLGEEKQGFGANPWRGKRVDADSFQDINGSCRQDLPSPTDDDDGAGGAHGSSKVGGAGIGIKIGVGRKGPQGDDNALKYVPVAASPRGRRGKSLELDKTGGSLTLTERESRMASEPGTHSTGNPTAGKPVMIKKGRPRRRGSVSRRRRGCSDASSGQGDDKDKEPAERRRDESTATDTTAGDDAPDDSTTTDLGQKDPPRNRHRRLRPRAMDGQTDPATRKSSASEVAAGAAGGASTAVHTPSAPANSRSSRTLVKTFW